MAPEATQNEALTIEQYRRLIHEIYKVILADGGTAGAPPTEDMPLDVEAPEEPAEATAEEDGPAVDEASRRLKRRAA